MSDSSTGEGPAWAGPHVPRLPGGSQDQVRQWVRRLVELTGWSASGLATEAGVVPSTVNRFLNAPVKHNLSTTTLNKLRAAAGPRIAERIEAGEIEPTAPGSVGREPPADAAAEAVAQALVHLPEIVADPAAFDAARRLIGADRRRGAALARLLPAGRASGQADSGALAADDYVLVATYDVAAAAGDGTVVDDDHVTGWLAFKPEWLRRVTVADPADLAVVTVRGDSMEHTLKHDDTVLVDFTQRRPQRDGIFVIRYADAVQVKRVSIHPVSRLLTVQSDNQAYPTYAGLSPDDIDIVGRVIWLGRQV